MRTSCRSSCRRRLILPNAACDSFQRSFRRFLRPDVFTMPCVFSAARIDGLRTKQSGSPTSLLKTSALSDAAPHSTSTKSNFTSSSRKSEKVSFDGILNCAHTSGSSTRLRESGRGCSLVTTVVPWTIE
jgi:hypothetical protein